MTERMADRQQCPFDLSMARREIEDRYASLPVTLEYSPLADGQEVLLHEVTAIAVEANDAGALCDWRVQVRFQGVTETREARTPHGELPPSLIHGRLSGQPSPTNPTR